MFTSTMMMQVRIRQSGVQGQRRVLSLVRSAVSDDLHLRLGSRRVRSALAGQPPNALNFRTQAFYREFSFATTTVCSGIPNHVLRSENETQCPSTKTKTPSHRIAISVEGILPEGDDDG
jgi:hypothetical protein